MKAIKILNRGQLRQNQEAVGMWIQRNPFASVGIGILATLFICKLLK